MMVELAPLVQILVCPNCYGDLIMVSGRLRCTQCGLIYRPNKYGFVEFILEEKFFKMSSPNEEYAQDQETEGVRAYYEYLRPLLFRETFENILEVGCGIGKAVSCLREEGFRAYGVDLPKLSKFWARVGNDPLNFLCADAARLPFQNNFFDVVFSLEVIEHIGTKIGHCTLSENYREVRQSYANELLRVTKPGGRIIINCPNKSFPIDITHGTRDALTPKSRMNSVRTLVFKKTGINIHPTWGRYHLLSYGEIKHYFCNKGGARCLEPLSLKGRYAFYRLWRAYLKPLRVLARTYLENLPSSLRPTFLNPIMLVQIRK